MDFELTPEQSEIQSVARELAAAEIEPYAADWDRAHGFPRELLDKLAEPGLLGVDLAQRPGHRFTQADAGRRRKQNRYVEAAGVSSGSASSL